MFCFFDVCTMQEQESPPGQDDPDEEKHQQASLNKWHDFESQFSLATEQSVKNYYISNCTN